MSSHIPRYPASSNVDILSKHAIFIKMNKANVDVKLLVKLLRLIQITSCSTNVHLFCSRILPRNQIDLLLLSPLAASDLCQFLSLFLAFNDLDVFLKNIS